MPNNNIIAFQGTLGAHSDLACRENYPYMDTRSYPSFDAAIEAVENNEAQLCMIPIENSQAGRVAEIHTILPKTSLYIVGEFFQKIEHHLLALKEARLEDIQKVYSHPQALLQCRKNLKSLQLETASAANTAIAASNIATWQDKTKAALASELASELYNLQIIQEHMQDNKDNTTIFVAMGREPIDPDPKEGKVITSLLFTVRNIPAVLYKSLGGFATNGINLLKVESYIPPTKSKIAQFFVSFEGHPAQKNVRLAIEELGFYCHKVKMLGCYFADPQRDLN